MKVNVRKIIIVVFSLIFLGSLAWLGVYYVNEAREANVDSAVFVPPEKIRKYDVALYRREGQAIMHRVVGFRGEDTLIRGDNSSYTETVPRRDIFGVMQGFYRGQRYVAATNLGYRLFSRCWVAMAPLLPLIKKIYHILRK